MSDLTKSQLLFGREPALWASLAQALVAVVAGFLVPLTTEQAGVVVGVVNALIGVLLAVKVRPVAPAAFTAFVQAVLALVVAFGLSLSPDQQGVLLTASSLLITAVLVRPQVTPKVTLDAVPVLAEGGLVHEVPSSRHALGG